MQLLSLVKKIEMLIFATVQKTIGFHLEALTAKNIKVYSLTPHSFTTFTWELPSPQKFLGSPAYFTRRHCVQVDAKDCNSRAGTITL